MTNTGLKILEENVRISVVASKSGVGKIHPGFATRVQDPQGNVYLTRAYRICTCPNSRNSCNVRLVSEGFEKVNCRS